VPAIDAAQSALNRVIVRGEGVFHGNAGSVR
jgi:hypothetical protein